MENKHLADQLKVVYDNADRLQVKYEAGENVYTEVKTLMANISTALYLCNASVNLPVRRLPRKRLTEEQLAERLLKAVGND